MEERGVKALFFLVLLAWNGAETVTDSRPLPGGASLTFIEIPQPSKTHASNGAKEYEA